MKIGRFDSLFSVIYYEFEVGGVRHFHNPSETITHSTRLLLIFKKQQALRHGESSIDVEPGGLNLYQGHDGGFGPSAPSRTPSPSSRRRRASNLGGTAKFDASMWKQILSHFLRSHYVINVPISVFLITLVDWSWGGCCGVGLGSLKAASFGMLLGSSFMSQGKRGASPQPHASIKDNHPDLYACINL